MPISQRHPSLRNGLAAASTRVSFQEPIKAAVSAKDAAGPPSSDSAVERLCRCGAPNGTALHAKGDCPYPPHPPQKYQWLPITTSGPILNA